MKPKKDTYMLFGLVIPPFVIPYYPWFVDDASVS